MTVPPRLVLFAARVGITGALLALAVTLLGIQTVRLDGLRLGPLAIEGWQTKAERLARELHAVARAQDEAAARAIAARKAAQDTYRDIAERIDDNARSQTEAAMAAADRYIAAHGVRPAPADCPPGGSFTPAGDRGARAAEESGATPQLDGTSGHADDALVIVKAADVRICTTNTLRAEAARDWAVELEAATAPDPRAEPD